MSLIQYRKPHSFLSEFQNDLSHFFLNPDSADNLSRMTASSDWIPAVDIIEQKDRFLIVADVPGIKSQDIEISMDKNILSIKGTRKSEAALEGEKFKRAERVRGVFVREFSIPESANTDNVQAKTVDGVLTVTIPKGEDIKPRKIVVK